MTSSGNDKVYITIGNSQIGKSSFINTLAGQTLATVGSRGRSTTLHVEKYLIGKSSKIFPGETSNLYLIDVPGFNDSCQRISNSEISNAILEKVLELENPVINAFLIFESCKADSQSHRIILNDLMNIFGSNVEASVIIIQTKWDTLDDEDYPIKLEVFNDLKKTFKCSKWINPVKNLNNLPVNIKNIHKDQLQNLAQELKKVTPYDIFNGIKHLEQERHKIAEELRNKDPNRFVIEKQPYEVDVPKEIDEVVKYQDTEPKYKTSSEINNRAYELQRYAGKRAVTKTRYVTQRNYRYVTVNRYRDVPYTRCITRSFLFMEVSREYYTVYKSELVPVQEKEYYDERVLESYIEYEDQPIGIFLERARNERVNVTKEKTVKKIVTEKEIRYKDVEREAHDFSHYLKLAKNQLALRYRNLCRRN
jgi:GTP-binding protein EngB required for normal cell division